MPDAPPKIGQKVALAAVILLCPGGFVLGATLAVRWWRDRAATVPSRESIP